MVSWNGRTVAVASTASELHGLSGEWAALVGDGSDVFAIPGVAAAWWEHLGQGRLHLVSVRDGGRLVAVAPLHVRRILGVRIARWLGHGLGAIGSVVVDAERPDSAIAVWEHLATSGLVLDLVDVPSDAGRLDMLRSCTILESRIEESDMCHVVDLAGDASFDAYLGDRPGLAKSLRRADRSLESQGLSVRSTIGTDPDEVRALVPDLVRISNAAELGHPRLDLFGPRLGEFSAAMLEASAATGNLIVSVLYLGDEPAAFDVCFRVGQTIKDYYGRFDPRWSRWSPGTLAQRVVIRYAIDEGISRVDLLLGDHPYKRRWSTGTYRTVNVLAAGEGRLRRATRWKQAAVVGYRAKTEASTTVATILAKTSRYQRGHVRRTGPPGG
jgi:CelD/BcsL family acetyltransferase involved in cellulose biosynthesis